MTSRYVILITVLVIISASLVWFAAFIIQRMSDPFSIVVGVIMILLAWILAGLIVLETLKYLRGR